MKDIVAVLVLALALIGNNCTEQSLEPSLNQSQADGELVQHIQQEELTNSQTLQDISSHHHSPGTEMELANFLILKDFPDWRSDPLNVRDVKIQDDHLSFNVVYPGGCRPHTFRLVSTTLQDEKPAHVFLKLYHDAHDDPCNAFVQTAVTFDLTALKEHYTEEWKVPCAVIELMFIEDELQRFNQKYRFCEEAHDE